MQDIIELFVWAYQKLTNMGLNLPMIGIAWWVTGQIKCKADERKAKNQPCTIAKHKKVILYLADFGFSVFGVWLMRKYKLLGEWQEFLMSVVIHIFCITGLYEFVANVQKSRLWKAIIELFTHKDGGGLGGGTALSASGGGL